MNPFLVMLQVLTALVEGRDVQASQECSPCPGQGCTSCGGTGKIPLSPLGSDSPTWRHEAELIVAQQGVLGLRDPLLRTVVVPMLNASRILADEERPAQRRCEEARAALARCAAEDWRRLGLIWVDLVEKGQAKHG
jgi:hypothetical protein